MPRPPGGPVPQADVPRSGGTGPRGAAAPRPGDIVTTTVTRAAPHYLLADAAPLAVRRTRAGDAWEDASAAV